MNTATALLFDVVTGVLPDPTPEQPPGTEGLTTAMNWLSWIVISLGLAGFLASTGYLAFAAFTGRTVNGVKGIVLCILVCILATSAGGILRSFL